MVLSKGQHLNNNKYIIEKVISQGQFGTIYQANHVLLGHAVVIKTPSETNRDHFNQEVEISASISNTLHHNIVKIRDFFIEDNQPYLVMDFVLGENLYESVKKLKDPKKRFPEAEAIKYIHQIGNALIGIHEAGFVHRDVNPGNIILQPNGNVILIDFGIAQQISLTHELTEDIDKVASQEHSNKSLKAFTKNFAPFEQISGTKDSNKPTVDIYSLAATFYFLLTGEIPENSGDRERLNSELIPPKNHVKGISNSLNSAIIRGMHLTPDKRPQSIREWLTEVSRDSIPQNKNLYRSPVGNLTSSSGVDYTSLESLLRKQKWQEADQMTGKLILEVLNREVEGWVIADDIKKIPCSDLRIIDKLWVHYSKSRFGFSVQTQIWESLGGNAKSDQKTLDTFCQQIGLHIKILWLDLGLSFNPVKNLSRFLIHWKLVFDELLDYTYRYSLILSLALSLIIIPIRLGFAAYRTLLFVVLSLPVFLISRIKRRYFPTTMLPISGIIVGRSSKSDNKRTHEQNITDANEDLVTTRQQVVMMMAELRRIEQTYNKKQSEANEWIKRAELAQQKGDSLLADECRRRQQSYNKDAEKLAPFLDNIKAEKAQLIRKLEAYEDKINYLRYSDSMKNWGLAILADKLKECGIE